MQTLKFKNKRDFLRFYRKNGSELLDNFFIGKNFYIMEEYDMSGKSLMFASIDADNKMEVETRNRYKSRDDARLNFYGVMCLRNDLHYIATRKGRLYKEMTDKGFPIELVKMDCFSIHTPQV